MKLKRIAAQAAIASALGASALGIGAGLASADPGGHGPCWGPYCQGDNRGDDGHGDRGDRGHGDDFRDYDRWDQRGIDQGRWDHRPFNYQGQRVEPYYDNFRGAWGFWFFGVWVSL